MSYILITIIAFSFERGRNETKQHPSRGAENRSLSVSINRRLGIGEKQKRHSTERERF